MSSAEDTDGVVDRTVLDASAAVYIAASRRGFAALRHHRFVAPSLFWSETLSALHQGVHRGVLSAELAGIARQRLAEASIDRTDPPELADAAWRIATDLGWAKTYDAEYVALAHILGIGLVTRDARLARGAARVVPVIGPTDL